jgi:predicted metal-dependent phosphoesterase TrpH
LKELQETRIARIRKMVAMLKKFGVDVDAEEVLKLSGKGSVGRLHLAQAMLKMGAIRRQKEAFDRYIGFGKPCYVPNVRFSPKEALGELLKVGGVPVIAHPSTIGKDEYIEEFMGYGLRGIEVYHSDHTEGMTEHYKALAEKGGLLATGGSDCHGLNKSRVLIGSVKMPYGIVERLREEAQKIRRNPIRLRNQEEIA